MNNFQLQEVALLIKHPRSLESDRKIHFGLTQQNLQNKLPLQRRRSFHYQVNISANIVTVCQQNAPHHVNNSRVHGSANLARENHTSEIFMCKPD